MQIRRSISVVLCAAVGAASAAGITILPGGQAKPYRGPAGLVSADAFYRESASGLFANSTAQILVASDGDSLFGDPNAQLRPSSESFVRGAIQAWAGHLHLAIRAEEVWFSILGQLNAYMAAHPDEVAGVYVNRPGGEPMLLDEYDYYRLMEVFKNEMESKAKVGWFTPWAFTNFTTTYVNDYMVVAVLMLGQPRAGTAPKTKLNCGLPSVTLVGEKADWADLLSKLDRFPAFGAEAAAYAAKLKPILTRFVSSFSEPDSAETKAFWNQIVSASVPPGNAAACDPDGSSISGWLTAFVHWTADGQPIASATTGAAAPTSPLTIDGVEYSTVRLQDFPIGYAHMPFILHDYHDTARFEASAMAGTIGQQISTGPPDGYAEALARAGLPTTFNVSAHSTLQPLSAWALYGPVDHDAPGVPWVDGEELADLASSIRRSAKLNGTQCSVAK